MMNVFFGLSWLVSVMSNVWLDVMIVVKVVVVCFLFVFVLIECELFSVNGLMVVFVGFFVVGEVNNWVVSLMVVDCFIGDIILIVEVVVVFVIDIKIILIRCIEIFMIVLKIL